MLDRKAPTDAEIKADFMDRLIRKHCWGAKYLPLDSLINWIAKQIKKDGRRVRKCVEDLAKDGYLLLHKRGEAVSLNPAKSKEIAEYVKTVLKT